MKHGKRILALCLAACMSLSLFACGRKAPADDPVATSGTAVPGEPGDYSVQITAETGAAFEGIGVYIYEDATLSELVWFAKTDAEGRMGFTAPVAEGYVAVLDKVPQGYGLEESYLLTGLNTQILLPVRMPSAEDLANLFLRPGDVMCDLSVTDIDGKTWQISQLLQEKKAVMLNFFYTDCNPCKSEFPYLEEAYQEYKDQVAVLALDPIDTDEKTIAAFAKELGLTFPVAACDQQLQKTMNLMAYPTTIVVDRYGIISLSHTGALESTANFTDIFAYFTADNYQPGVVEDIETLLVTEDEEQINNPTSIAGVTTAQITVKPGKVYYCDIYRMDGMYLSIRSENAYLIYNGRTIKGANGYVGTTLFCKDTRTPTNVGFGNSGTETETFTLTFSAPAGSVNNPHGLKLEQFETSIPGGSEQGVFYRYAAASDGYLVLTCLSASQGVTYDFKLTNTATMAVRQYTTDGFENGGSPAIEVAVKKGEVVEFNPSTVPDSSGSYPAGRFTFQAELSETSLKGEASAVENLGYAITVTDADRKPLKGVSIKLTTVSVAQTDPPMDETTIANYLKKEYDWTTDEKGVAKESLPKGTYKAVIDLADTYEGEVTELTLTDKFPMQSIVLKVLEPPVEYTVKVVDEAGKPMAHVVVIRDTETRITDETGTVTFTLREGEYAVNVMAPEGFQPDGNAYPFDENRSLTVVLKKEAAKPTDPTDPSEPDSGETEPSQPPQVMLDYTVTVTDGSKPMAGIYVLFQKDGAMVAMKQTDAQGKATASLKQGEYTASLSFSGTEYYYDPAALVFTGEVTSAAVRLVPKLDKSDFRELYVGNGYHISLGETYVDGMQTNVTTYFVFNPTQSGVYRFTSSNPAAVLSYQGAGEFYIANQTAATDFKDNSFTREIREDQTENTLVILGITGAENTVLTVVRERDIQLSDEEKAEWIVYEGTMTPPSKPVYKPTETGRLTMVDLTVPTSDYPLVLGDDGFYHIGDKNGPLMYVRLGPNGYRYVSFYQMMGNEQAGGTFMHRVFYDENGNFLKKEEYTECFKAYTLAVDAAGEGLYPLTEDLKYIIQNGGEAKEWWKADSPNYLFTGISNLNPEIAWLFNCCYFK